MSDSPKGADLRSRLLGTWRLVSAVREEVPSGRKTDMFGANPTGFLTYGPEGRMIALIVRSGRARPAGAVPTAAEAEGLLRSVVSYAGPYSVDGDQVTHRVDISWNESWTGTVQTRTVRFDGARLVLSTPVSRDPLDGLMSVRTMTWERVAA
jgi:hypothetical protein